MTDTAVKSQLAQAMAEDFERDMVRDGVGPDAIRAQITRSKARITSAPAAVLLCLDMNGMDAYPDERRQQAERTMAVQSVAAAGLQLLLAAHAEGLGGVWACWPLFAQQTIQRTLALPDSWEPHGMYFLGYPEITPRPRERKGLEEISLFI